VGNLPSLEEGDFAVETRVLPEVICNFNDSHFSRGKNTTRKISK
jgi:hypothetical protein